MFYRLRLTANFITPPDLDGLRGWLSPIRIKVCTINAGMPHSEPSTAIIELCYHDDQPTAPCEVLYEWHTEP